jgi:hypothetical protein
LPTDYCREIEAYLCRKNDGHLIRVVGPSFDLVSRWAADGVPLKVAFRGIDQYFERYYRKGARRRPVRIDFCDADVRDVFDEWRKAVGLTAEAGPDLDAEEEMTLRRTRKGASLPAHLERVLARLTSARATGRFGAEGDVVMDRLSRELDQARASAGGVRGDARRALLDRLSALDVELGALALASIEADDRKRIERDAAEELAAFRDRLAPDAYERAKAVVIDRLARARLGLPTVSFA